MEQTNPILKQVQDFLPNLKLDNNNDIAKLYMHVEKVVLEAKEEDVRALLIAMITMILEKELLIPIKEMKEWLKNN